MKKDSYKRGWHHTVKRGRETMISCSFCGRQVPKYKTFVVFRGFKINDPLLRKEMGRRNMLSTTKMYACPSCARFHRIVRKK
jgi:small subunit ribosomal protein S26e